MTLTGHINCFGIPEDTDNPESYVFCNPMFVKIEDMRLITNFTYYRTIKVNCAYTAGMPFLTRYQLLDGDIWHKSLKSLAKEYWSKYYQ